MALVHKDGDAVQVERHVMLAIAVETEDVRHPGTAAAFNANAKTKSVRDVLLAHDLPDLNGRTI